MVLCLYTVGFNTFQVKKVLIEATYITISIKVAALAGIIIKLVVMSQISLLFNTWLLFYVNNKGTSMTTVNVMDKFILVYMC